MSSGTLANQVCIAFTTCNDPQEAERLAEAIVTERLAACVNIIGNANSIQSIYIWEGKVQKEKELLLLIKTKSEQLPQLQKRIQELHRYDVPEFIAIPLIFGGQSYLQWIMETVV